MEKKNKKYCSYCGAVMIECDAPAEKAKRDCCTFGGCYKVSMGTAFNTENGKKQYVKEFICPEHKEHRIFQSPHDRYYIDNVFAKG